MSDSACLDLFQTKSKQINQISIFRNYFALTCNQISYVLFATFKLLSLFFLLQKLFYLIKSPYSEEKNNLENILITAVVGLKPLKFPFISRVNFDLLSFYNFDPNDTWNVEGRVLRPGHRYCSQATVRACTLSAVTRVISQLLTWITLATVTATNVSNFALKYKNQAYSL